MATLSGTIRLFVCERSGHAFEIAEWEEYAWCPICGGKGRTVLLEWEAP